MNLPEKYNTLELLSSRRTFLDSVRRTVCKYPGQSVFYAFRYGMCQETIHKNWLGKWKDRRMPADGDIPRQYTELLNSLPNGITYTDELVCFADPTQDPGFHGREAVCTYGRLLTVTVSVAYSNALHEQITFQEKVRREHPELLEAIRRRIEEDVLRPTMQADRFAADRRRAKEERHDLWCFVTNTGFYAGSGGHQGARPLLNYADLDLQDLASQVQTIAMAELVRDLFVELLLDRGFRLNLRTEYIDPTVQNGKPVFRVNYWMTVVLPANVQLKEW